MEPGNWKNAAYKWVAAEDGTIYITGKYVKFANSEDASADGTVLRIFVKGEQKEFIDSNIKGNFGEERSVDLNYSYQVEAGDEVMFAVSPENNDNMDGGRLEVTISDTAP